MSYLDNFTPEEVREMANSSISMRELARKLGYQSIGNNTQTIKTYLSKNNIDISHFTGVARGLTKRDENNVFVENSTATQATLRRWYLKGQYSEYKCAICGLPPFWNGKELTLTLDHINGRNHDDRLENLRWICPNCDRQLPTFGSKNGQHEVKKPYANTEEIVSKVEKNKSQNLTNHPNKEELQEVLLQNKGNFTKVGTLYGVTDNAVRKWCKKYGMPFHSADYK